jgi:ABC-2 type transport system permease protein
MNARRVLTLIGKDLLELSRNASALFPTILMAVVCVIVPLAIGIVVPLVTGESLAEDDDLRKVLRNMAPFIPALKSLPQEAGIQAFFFQQFLTLFLMIPVAGAMAFASHAVIGEKQARTLEPLLATPLTTAELLTAKLVASLAPSLLLEFIALTLYLIGIAAFAEPGVAVVVISLRTLLIVGVLGPLTAGVALELALIVSSRVNDPRSAQQIGVIVILPITGLLAAQLTGAFWLSIPWILLASAGLAIVFVILMVVGVALFEREAILTRWK